MTEHVYTCADCDELGATHPFHHYMTPWLTQYLCDGCYATTELAEPELTPRELEYERREFDRLVGE